MVFFLLNVLSFICSFAFGLMCKCIIAIDKIIAQISIVLVALSISINSPCFINIVLLYCPLHNNLVLSPLDDTLLLFEKILYV